MSIFVVILDASIVNVALPAISKGIGGDEGSMQWIIDGYALAMASFLISSGVLADRGGRRRFFRFGLVLFGLGSLLCSAAPTIHVLIAARVLQGFGGSMLNPVALAIIANVYVDPARRARAMGVWGAVLGVAMALGPVLGGFLVDSAGWPSIFWINVPVCAVAVWAARFLPESFGDRGRRLDIRGQACTVGAMFALVLAIIELPRLGAGSPWIWAAFGASGVCAAAAVAAMSRAEHPFIDVRSFRNPQYVVANLCGFAGAGGQGVLVFALSLSLQASFGLSATAAGLYLLPMAVGTFVCSAISGRAVARVGTIPPLFAGGLGIAASGATLLAFSPTSWETLVGVALFGAGLGLANAPTAIMGIAGMGANAGAASGVVATCRQLGIGVGVALAGSLADPSEGKVAPSWVVLCVCGALVAASASALWLRSDVAGASSA
ncbi:MFS transporter [Segniliparus rugosus]|uniref:MFS transporter n=1 Tax=Segniliparus rugosus TaxID=286804 RepID=UPI0001F03C23|nr:MFS transporter [Segniliparus rugosus]